MAGSMSISCSVTFLMALVLAESSSVPDELYSMATKKIDSATMIPNRKPTHRLLSKSALFDFFISNIRYTKRSFLPLYKP